MMKKLIAILIMIISAFPVILAQGTVTGMVVDKKGNPLPGVKIEIPGTPDQAISDLDGTFTINRSDITKRKVYATYAGMRPAKVKISDNTVIKMREENWWSMKPEKWQWFAEAMVALPNAPGGDIFNPAYGFMVGRVKKFGYYLKAVTNTFSFNDGSENSKSNFWEKQTSHYFSLTGGAIVRLGCPIHLYAGIGTSEYVILSKNLHNEWGRIIDTREAYPSIDIGMMLRIKAFTLSAGTTLATEIGECAGNFGIGFSF